MIINDYKDKRSDFTLIKYVQQCLKYLGTSMKFKCNYILRDISTNYHTYLF